MMGLLSKVIRPREKTIKHRRGLLDDALFLVRKQCEPLSDKINLPTLQDVNKRAPSPYVSYLVGKACGLHLPNLVRDQPLSDRDP
jgi:hypothetical protein